MKLDQIALFAIAFYIIFWGAIALFGSSGFNSGFVLLALIPLALFLGLLVTVLIQRLNNKEDNYYDENVDQ